MKVVDLLDMTNRHVVITGGAGYLGQEFAVGLYEIGARITLIDREERLVDRALKSLKQRCGGENINGMVWDLANRTIFEASAETLLQNQPNIDVLINNAAFVGTSDLSGWVENFEKQTIDTFRDAIDINLAVPFALTQKLSKSLQKSTNGSVINIGSIYGVVAPDMELYQGIGGMGNPAGYAASKGGLLQLTRWLSTVMAPKVRVNMVSPGGIERGQDAEFVNRYVARTPLRRMATEQDIVGAVIYLASGFGQYVTGQNLVVDGGFTVW